MMKFLFGICVVLAICSAVLMFWMVMEKEYVLGMWSGFNMVGLSYFAGKCWAAR